MSFHIQLEEDGKIARTIYQGTISFTELTEAYAQRFKDPETVKKYRLIISDFTAADLINLTLDHVKALVEMSSRAEQINPHVIVVGIMPGSHERGLGRLWQAFSTKTQWESWIFDTADRAQEFVEKVLREE